MEMINVGRDGMKKENDDIKQMRQERRGAKKKTRSIKTINMSCRNIGR